MKVWIARSNDGYTIDMAKRKPRVSIIFGVEGSHGRIWMCSRYFHKITDIRLKKGQVKQFEFKGFKEVKPGG